MTDSPSPYLLTRRTVAFGGATSSLVAASLIRPAFADQSDHDADKDQGSLPVKQIEQILQAKGKMSHGILSINIDRKDLKSSLPGNIPVTPGVLLNGTFYFQSIGSGKAALNADFCLKLSETNKFIDALIENGLVVQAFHQHLSDLSPMYWFQHFRGEDDPIKLAKALHAAIKVTSTPLPQHPPAKTATPFDHERLEKILGGSAEVGSNGVVSISVKRAETISLGGRPIKRGLGVASTIAIQPLNSAGDHALAIPDFALIGKEVDPVFRKMRSQGFTIGCLYNQETDEKPQLYFSHQWSTGNPYDLAQKIRDGLNLTNSKFKS